MIKPLERHHELRNATCPFGCRLAAWRMSFLRPESDVLLIMNLVQAAQEEASGVSLASGLLIREKGGDHTTIGRTNLACLGTSDEKFQARSSILPYKAEIRIQLFTFMVSPSFLLLDQNPRQEEMCLNRSHRVNPGRVAIHLISR
jgi:hypothetical protein